MKSSSHEGVSRSSGSLNSFFDVRFVITDGALDLEARLRQEVAEYGAATYTATH